MKKDCGDTILHFALLMDFDLKRLLVSYADLAAHKYSLSAIKKVMSKESHHSLEIKCKVVQILLGIAKANPRIPNAFGVTAFDIAKQAKINLID